MKKSAYDLRGGDMVVFYHADGPHTRTVKLIGQGLGVTQVFVIFEDGGSMTAHGRTQFEVMADVLGEQGVRREI